MEELTRDKILGTPAGRDLDRLVARHVLGRTGEDEEVPPYSTDRDATEEVEEKLKSEFNIPDWTPYDGALSVDLIPHAPKPHLTYKIESEGAPVDICRIALLAKLEE